ncbi:MAG: hypothetical protein ACI9DC_003355 [Gammaproteobacteria bacterium]
MLTDAMAIDGQLSDHGYASPMINDSRHRSMVLQHKDFASIGEG